MDHSQYLGIFLDEARDILQLLNEKLLFLETHREDRKTLDEIFRAAHTLKGMAATMGFAGLTELTHQMENVLDALRQGEVTLDTPLTDTLFGCVDSIGMIIEAIADSQAEPDVGSLVERLQLALAKPEPEPSPGSAGAPQAPGAAPISGAPDAAPKLDQYEKAVVAEAHSHGFRTVWVIVDLAEGCLLKGVRAYMVINALETLGELIKASPPVPDLEEERFDQSFAVLLVTRSDDPAILDRIDGISEVAHVLLVEIPTEEGLAPEVEPIAPEAPRSEAGAISGEADLDLLDLAASAPGSAGVPTAPSALPVERVVPAARGEAARTEVKSTSRPEGKASAADAAGSAARPDSKGSSSVGRVAPTVRVATERLDSLVNLVGELVIDRTRLQQVAGQYQIEEISDVIRHVGSVIADIHAVVMKLRMMPVERVFSRFPRMVRDLGRELGKEVQLLIEGQETELDRLMIDEIADPLLHLLRNSVDHGLETPDERELMGKPRLGTVNLRARHEGNHVIIEVQDDGKGMDPERIKRKAVEKGLLSGDEAVRLSDKQALDLIFTPGFSTRDEATDISGRGVGMDAVKSKTVALGGALDLSSTSGKGSQISIILPLTLAIIQCMLTEVGREIYAIPISFIEDAHDFEDLTVQTVQEKQIALLRGHS
ncbi:MAG: chemotaxis protein CheA, partial [Candidatus Sericytochromatia bacterium]|nr:chemotaxis protein CheA [Candidatus Tanganyikabacteria bacterium]